MFSLSIIYTPEGGRPLSLARVLDRSLLRSAAAAALREAERRGQCLMAKDGVLGMVQREETDKLRRVLMLLLAPEYDSSIVM
jgi:hypothetical protein